MKGHCEILLQDAEKSTVKKIDADNLVTNAFKYMLNYFLLADTLTNPFPVAEKLLGGVLLFDGSLTESATNVHFPTEAHLVGYGDADSDTSDPMRGTYNSLESGPTSQGYTLVWDFSTSQCNGTIGAVALTNRNLLDTDRMHYGSLANGLLQREGNIYYYPRWPASVYHDGDYGYYPLSSGNQVTIKRGALPCGNIKTSTPRDFFPNSTTSWTDVASITVDGTAPVGNFSYSATGNYLVAAKIVSTTESSGGTTRYINTLSYEKISVSDWSYSGATSVAVDGIIGHSLTYRCWAGDYVYATYNTTIYRIDPTNISDVRTYTFDAKYTIVTIASAHSNGLITVMLRDSTAASYPNRWAFIYPDGAIVYGNYTRFTDSDVSSLMLGYCSYSDTLYRFSWAQEWAYLGTICNLSSPVTKTAATTMKLIYTLTDV